MKRQPRLRIVIVVLAALAVATFGVVRLAARSEALPAASHESTVDSLTAAVVSASWTEMDHDMAEDAPGYQMPPAMMPGMPEGDDQRLAVAVTVDNSSDATRPLRPKEEFALFVGEDGRRLAPHSTTFGDIPRLAPSNAVHGVLFFDLPPAELADFPAWLEWTHGGTAVRLTLPAAGELPPSHSHNP